MRYRSHNLTRRGLLGRGIGLSLGGLHAAELDRMRAVLAADPLTSAEGSAKPPARSCVFIFLFGGPSHIDLWDMKPQAPVEVRGDFESIATNVSGITLCEHLPLIAQQMDKLCLVRSMTHQMNVHGPACSEVYSGRPYFGPPVTDQAREEDWPSLASLVHRYGRPRGSLPHSVVLPWYTQFVGQDRRIAGQTGGRMGDHFDPFLVEGDFTSRDFRMGALALPGDMSQARFQRRLELRQRIEPFVAGDPRTTQQTLMTESHFRAASELVERTEAAGVLDLSREPASIRERYGLTKFGQSLLMARRLIEAGVSLITVNWDDDSKFDKVSPHWDTHHDNFAKLKSNLCPPFDRGLAAFVADLQERGLLETTLVVALGEFGRTPKIGLVTQNGMTEPTGRDHWPHAFTALAAGGGVRGGQVYGATTPNGGYVADKPVTPADLAVTIFQHLGIDATQEYDDHFLQIRQQLATGRAVDFS
ncbi:MAG: DUF1501 domain-containing protein [Planctomycetaceae bacterium]|nr:DUF1501 domain-containing protein [Planctomycetaceae bacterium]